MRITIKLEPGEVKRLYIACRYMANHFAMLANQRGGNIGAVCNDVAKSFDEISHKLYKD